MVICQKRKLPITFYVEQKCGLNDTHSSTRKNVEIPKQYIVLEKTQKIFDEL